MATQKDIIKRHLQVFKDIKSWTVDYVNDEIINCKLSDRTKIKRYKEVVERIDYLVDLALDQAIYDNIDEENLALRTEEENTRNVPIEPMAKATYVISRIKSDVDRFRACREYNLNHGVDLKKHGIKYEYRLTKQEYRDIVKDYKYIIEKLNGELRKHRPVFEELIMKDLTLEEYGRLKKGNGSNRQYLIKWAFNKKTSFIKALARCYANEMSSMKYYDGIQAEKGLNGRDLYLLEREEVCNALKDVDSGLVDYFEAMKNAYDKLFEMVAELRGNQ